VTINNKRQTLRDDHPTSFFYHHPKKKHHIISASQKPSIIRQAEETRDWASPDVVVVAAAADDIARMHTGNRLEGFKPYRPTSTLARMVHAARSAYAHNSLTYIHSHTHTHNRPSVECFKPCAWQKSAAAAAAAAFATVPSPRVSP